MLPHKLPVVFRRDDLINGVRIGGGKRFGRIAFRLAVPLELEGMQPAVLLLHQVDFLLLMGAPKEQLGKMLVVGIAFHPLAHHQIRP